MQDHAKAVAEVGYTERHDNEPPAPTSFRSRPATFGSLMTHPMEDKELKESFDKIIAELDPLCQAWCQRCREDDVKPSKAYQDLGIDRNYFNRKMRPKLKRLFGKYNR